MFNIFKKNNQQASADFSAQKQELSEYADNIKEEKQKRNGNNEEQVSGNVEKSIMHEFDKNKWLAPKVLKTNLIKDEEESYVELKSYLNPLFVKIGCVFGLIIIAYIGLIVWEREIGKEGEKIGKENEVLWNKISVKEKEIQNADLMRQKTEQVGDLLNDHVYWTKFFQEIERITLPDVYYLGGFSGSIDGDFSLKGEAKDYKTAASQLAVFRSNSMISEAEITGMNFAAASNIKEFATTTSADALGRVAFDIKFKVNGDIFKKNDNGSDNTKQNKQ